MGWIDDTGRHELYIACVFPDGMSGGTYSSRGIEVDTTADGQHLPIDDPRRDWRPDSEVSGWQVCCDCYTSEALSPSTTVLATWQRVHPPEAEDPAHGRFHAADDDAAGLSDREDAADLALALWQTHRAPGLARQAVADAAQAARLADRQLDQAVLAGRAAGLYWADIGRAVGITRDGARQRWGSPPTR